MSVGWTRHTMVIGLALLGGGVVAIGCTARDHDSGSTPATQASAVVMTMPALVGYDIRRIRPQPDPLDVMFERMWNEARNDGKRVALLFSADWCDACKKLELEFGNMHPPGTIEDVRILQFVEEDWESATRMDEVYELRTKYYRRVDNYPVMVLLDIQGAFVEEMADASKRLEAAGDAPSMVNWFQQTRPTDASGAQDAPPSTESG